MIIRKVTSTIYNFQIIEDIEGRGPDIFIEKNVLRKISCVAVTSFDVENKDVRATLFNYIFFINATKIPELRSCTLKSA